DSLYVVERAAFASGSAGGAGGGDTPAAAYAASSSGVSCSGSALARGSRRVPVSPRSAAPPPRAAGAHPRGFAPDGLFRLPRPPPNGPPAPSRGSSTTGPSVELIPQRPTIRRASSVNCSRSDSAPVLISPKTTSSATRPPSDTLIFASTSGKR